MAHSKYNVITHGFSGKIGDLVIFSQRNGRTIIGKVPFKSGKMSQRQEQVRERFVQAVNYAKACMSDPDLKALYAQRAVGDVTPFNLAIADFFTPPTIPGVNTDGYAGNIGETIGVMATDDTKVKGVTVSILKADGSLVEEGAAVHDMEADRWIYTTTAANAGAAGCRVVTTATDLPGNTVSVEVTL